MQSASNITSEKEIQLVQQAVKKQVAKSHYENIPLEIRKTTGNYTTIHETKAAIYRKFSFKRTTVNA